MKKNMMKKLLALALAGAMMLSVVACGSKEDTASGDSTAKETIMHTILFAPLRTGTTRNNPASI